jgi:hypothetical protein
MQRPQTLGRATATVGKGELCAAAHPDGKPEGAPQGMADALLELFEYPPTTEFPHVHAFRGSPTDEFPHLAAG